MKPMHWAFSGISQALAKQLVGPAPTAVATVDFIQTDSRQVKAGDLFVCLKGDRFDAHDFAEQVVQAGATGLVTQRKINLDVPQWIVKDTRVALGALAAAWRNTFDLPVLAVVGSNGKTTSKEMLASICKHHFGAEHVLVTRGNLNNEIGVPLTLLALRNNHRIAVIEMGMNHPGEIACLAGLVSPNVVLLTNAQREHQEFMKSVDAVALENGSAFEHLKAGGTAVFPANTAFEPIWLKQAAHQHVVRFGQGGSFSVFSNSALLAQATLSTPQGECLFVPAFIGDHNLNNAAGAAAAAIAAGCTLQDAAAGLAGFQPVNGRLQLAARTPDLLLIDDTYNANPDSVNAASAVLGAMAGQTLLVLGDMGEVGDQSESCHFEVGQVAKSHGVNFLYALGHAAQHSVRGFGVGAAHFESVEHVLDEIEKTIGSGQWTVLIKGSRFMKMERVVQGLIERQDLLKGNQHAS